MDLAYKYRESLKEYSVEENGYNYYMPYSYLLQLQEFVKNTPSNLAMPVETWYINLKDLERRVVARKPLEEEKRSSLW